MKSLLSWLLTPIFLVLFGSILIIFQPLIMIAHLCGREIRHRMFNWMCWVIVNNLRVTGTRFVVSVQSPWPAHGPLVIVANHQSMFDIPLIIWVFRKFNPKFISKRELGHWIPSISFALRNFGSVLIDRKNPKQALPAIRKFGTEVERLGYAACIFPEGTRAHDGHMKSFKVAGLTALLEAMPQATIMPVAISGSWEITKYKLLPVPFGITFCLTSLKGIDRQNKSPETLIQEIEHAIRRAVAP